LIGKVIHLENHEEEEEEEMACREIRCEDWRWMEFGGLR
jgi:hypothetical protein